MNESDASRPARLSSNDAEVVTAQVVALAATGLPLATGLRAAAEEAPSDTTAHAFQRLAMLLEQGRTLDDALTALGPRFPDHLRRLLAPLGPSQLRHQLLTEWCDQRRRLEDVSRAVRRALGYPLLLIVLTMIIIVAIPLMVSREYGLLYTEMQIKLPVPTRIAIWMGGPVGWILLAGIVGLAPLVGVLRWIAGPSWWRTSLARLPIVGRLWYWMSVSEWSRTMALLLDAGTTLPESLALAAGGEQDFRIAQSSRAMSESVAAGIPLSVALGESELWPATAAVVVRRGEQTNQMADALRGLAEIYELRVQMRSHWLRLVLPPFVFVLVGYGLFFTYSNFMLPMVELISKLS